MGLFIGLRKARPEDFSMPAMLMLSVRERIGLFSTSSRLILDALDHGTCLQWAVAPKH